MSGRVSRVCQNVAPPSLLINMANKAVYIVGAARTAFGAFGGALKDKTATELATVAARGALDKAGVDAHAVGAAFCGNVCQVGTRRAMG